MRLPESPAIYEPPLIAAEGKRMRRDNDLVRRLMLDFENSDDTLLVQLPELTPSQEGEKIYYHLQLLADAGFLEEQGRGGGVFRMTNAGHDFCAAIRDDTIWGKTKYASTQVAGVSLGVMKDIGIGYLRARLVELGVPLA